MNADKRKAKQTPLVDNGSKDYGTRISTTIRPKFVDVDGIKTRFFEAGKGRPIVFVHGGQFGSYYSAYTWSLNIPSLAQNNFHVLAFDKLGMGYTDNPKRDGDYTIGRTLQHAHDFVETMQLKDINLIGHSRGAFLAARFALEYPRLVRNLVVVDSNTLAPDDPSTPRGFYLNLEKKAPKKETRRSVQREVRANSFSTAHITKDFVEELYTLAKLPKIAEVKKKMASLANRVFLPDLEKKRKETLELISSGKLKTPVLMVWGYNDPSAPINLAWKLFDVISSKASHAQLHVFDNAGHYSFREHADDFNGLVSLFLRRSE